MLRVFRILKLARYNAAVRRFHVALMLAKEEIILFMVLTRIVLYLAAVGIDHFEHEVQIRLKARNDCRNSDPKA